MSSAVTRACCLLCGLLLSGIVQAADPSFELPLHELKKPSLPPSPPKAAAGGRKASKKPRKHRTETAAATAGATEPAPAVAQAPASEETSPAVEEVQLTAGLPCWFAGQVAGVLAAQAPADPLLRGFRLAPVALPRHEGATVVVTCGLPAAEAYTTARLLETRHLGLVNLTGDESAENVLEQVLGGLGFSYVVEGAAGERRFLVSLQSEPETLLRLLIKP